jgi:hypothetical protein
MFRTYVSATTGYLVDFDRALLLMDGELVDAILAAMMHGHGTCPPADASQGAQ